jgi:hypothetical protein
MTNEPDEKRRKRTRHPVPDSVKRDILVEAGYRCAMPRCMVPTLEIAHILACESGGDNSRENLIALCPNHHTQYDLGEKIDMKAMRIIKNKLGIISGRYNDFEQRVFRRYADNPKQTQFELTNSTEVEILLWNAVNDGYIRKVSVIDAPGADFEGGYKHAVYEITPEGKDFIRKWLSEEEELA